jgi:1-aminocyclopropane-1-carboxylate deaminase/D-cysteine desulfhydrase-like pyridoxal-dependent ACC family enzyme
MLGMEIILLLRGNPNTPIQGNVLINHLLGADVQIHDVSSTKVLEDQAVVMAEELRARGRRPFILNHAPMFATASAVGYIESLLETVDQMTELGAGLPTHMYMTSGSKGQAGLILARKALGMEMQVVGVAASPATQDRRQATAKIGNDAARLLGLNVTVELDDVVNTDRYVADGYGVPSAAGIAAIKEVARKEGILLDPVYTSKGMAGVLDHIRTGIVPQGSTVVFVHTGGQPALFSHTEALLGTVR